jgi:hypothetical protein
MNTPATIIRSTDGRAYKVGPFAVGQVLSMIAAGRLEGISPSAPGLHATTHQDGGTDEINVTGLTGLLSTPQTPATHTHTEADVTGLVADLAAKEATANKGIANGYASLDAGTKVPIAQIPTGTSGTTVPFGNDARFTDTRTPTDNTVSTAKIQANAVDLTKLLDIATASFLGRTTAATGDPEVLTATQATALLDVFTSSLKGVVPASGGGTTNFLRADGTWAAAGGSVGDPAQQSYTPGSFTLVTGKYAIMAKRLQLTTTQRATIEGTAQLRIV